MAHFFMDIALVARHILRNDREKTQRERWVHVVDIYVDCHRVRCELCFSLGNENTDFAPREPAAMSAPS